MLVNVVPPSVLTCHCTVSRCRLPLAAAVKVTLWPALTDWLLGCVVIESTVSVAALLVSVPLLLVKTA